MSAIEVGWLLTANIALAAVSYQAGRWIRSRQPAPPPVPAPEPPPADPSATILAQCTAAYDHGDNTAGRQLADYLRTRAPDTTDHDIARIVLGLIGVATHVRKATPLGIDPLHALAGLMGRAAADLTSLTREDHPA